MYVVGGETIRVGHIITLAQYSVPFDMSQKCMGPAIRAFSFEG